MFKIIGTKRLAELEARVAIERSETLGASLERDAAKADVHGLRARLDTLSRRLVRTEVERDEALAKIQRMTGNLRRGPAKTAQHTNGG